MTENRPRRNVSAVIIALVALVALAAWLYDGQRAETATEKDKAEAAYAALDAQCEAGIQSACHQLDGLDEVDDPEAQEDEIQEPEVQEPERQDLEVQEPERDDVERDDRDPNDPELQDPETQDTEVDQPEQQDSESDDPEVDDPDANDPELQDDEVQDSEQQDPEVDDAEIQEDEIQDPEVDDPDPNSVLTFAAVDNCSPPAGEVVTGVDLTMLRDPDTSSVTYVLSCTSAPIASLIDLPGNNGH